MFQCALAAFEGLFPGDHDGRAQDLLFAMAHWHSLAKLRMHTDLSLRILDSWTSILGEAARVFAKLTCSRFETRELKSEYDARKRRESKKFGQDKGGKKSSQPADQGVVATPFGQSSQ